MAAGGEGSFVFLSNVLHVSSWFKIQALALFHCGTILSKISLGKRDNNCPPKANYFSPFLLKLKRERERLFFVILIFVYESIINKRLKITTCRIINFNENGKFDILVFFHRITSVIIRNNREISFDETKLDRGIALTELLCRKISSN